MEKLSQILLLMIPFIFSLSFHEAAHAWMANRCGDPTARMLGRLTLNPAPHIDPVGTLLFPIIAFLTGAPLIGWAKPVPVVERNLRNIRMDGLYVAAAGPVSNFILAIAFTFALALLNQFSGGSSDVIGAQLMVREPLMMMVQTGILLNLILGLFNLIPIPPLDGGRIFSGLFPQLGPQLEQLERYGFIVLYALFFLGLLRFIVFQPAFYLYYYLLQLAS